MKKLIITLVVATVWTGSALARGKPTPEYDVNKPAWFNGLVVETYARIPTPGSGLEPSPQRPDVTAYLVGNIYDVTPFGGEQVIPLPPGPNTPPFLTVPAHDDVFSRWSPRARPADAFGFWVVPGQAAITADGDPNQNVKVRSEPSFSIAGGPLAYAVKLRGRWQFLTAARVVERAIDEGLLQAIPSGPDGGFGGVGWLQPAIKR